jgi:hypothetical protein
MSTRLLLRDQLVGVATSDDRSTSTAVHSSDPDGGN